MSIQKAIHEMKTKIIKTNAIGDRQQARRPNKTYPRRMSVETFEECRTQIVCRNKTRQIDDAKFRLYTSVTSAVNNLTFKVDLRMLSICDVYKLEVRQIEFRLDCRHGLPPKIFSCCRELLYSRDASTYSNQSKVTSAVL